MDLIERYLAAVGRELPSKQAADIMAELRDVLLSRVEEQEEARGRPLNREELEALLVEFGHPLVVAGRYRKVQHLIGPEIFPFWWAAVKVMLTVVAGVYLVLIVLGAITDKTPAEFNRAVPSIFYVAVYLFGIITLVCMAIERFGKVAALQKWKPRNLPPAQGKSRSPFELGISIAWNVVFIMWWLGAWRFRDVMPADPMFLVVDLAPVWMTWRWAIVGYCVLEIVVDVLALVQPGRPRITGGVSIVRYLVGIGILGQIIQAGHWLVVDLTRLPEHAKDSVQTNFDLGMQIGIGATIAIMAIQIARVAWRLNQLRQSEGSLLPAI